MDKSAKRFFQEILETPSPSGYEQPVQEIVRKYVADFADEVRTDLHGNVIAVRNPNAPLRVMFAGHADQIGLIVSHINENGFIYTQHDRRLGSATAHRPADDDLHSRWPGPGRHRPQADSPARSTKSANRW